MDTVDIDVENLFNDGQLDEILPTGHGLAPTTLATPGLAEHFLNLRFSGGSNRVSWSRQGHIAIISDDGSSVSVRCLRSSTKDREWKLSNPRPVEGTFENAVNATWSPSGFDLAITDARGRTSVYSMTTTAINRVNESRSAIADLPDELGMPIGVWWLNQDRPDRPRNIVSSTMKGSDRWAHITTKAKALGPLYTRAFCMVNRRGVLSMLYQRSGARYTRISANLPSSTDTMYSHAAFSPTTEGKMLLAVYSLDGNLAVYLVTINWPPDLLTDLTSTAQPTFTIEVVSVCVSMWTEVDGASASLTQGYKPDDWVLTHLSIIPTTEVETADREHPSIWAVYTLTNPAASAVEDGYLLNSVIRRWSVYPFVRSLHPLFNDIPTKTESDDNVEDIYMVERLADLVFSQAITSFELIDAGQMVGISTADGRTEFWNPLTQALISFEGQPNEITSLAQFGFTYPPAMDTTTTTLSPNACATLTMSSENKLSIHHMQDPVQNESHDLDLTDSHQDGSVAAVVLAFARSCWSNTNGDDLLNCISAGYTPRQYITIVAELYRTLFRDTEFIHEKAPGSEAERMLSKPMAIKLLSFQMALYNNKSVLITSADEHTRYAALASTWSWLAINFRYIATAFYIFYREYQSSNTSLSPSFVDAICNTIHLVLDLFRFILTTILEIGDRQTNPDLFTPPTFSNNLGDVQGDGSQGLVALILNCQWSRSFLSAISRAMRAFMESGERGHNPSIAKIVQTISRYSVAKGMNISAIDKLLDPRWYARNGLRKGEDMDNAIIAQRQIAMCSSGRVGPEYAGTLRNLLNNVINHPETGLRATNEIERLKLWTDTPDLNWLLLGFNPQLYAQVQSNHTIRDPSQIDNSNQTLNTEKLYDIHRKSMFVVSGLPDQLVRRCVRCGSVSGDVEGVDKTWSKNMVGYLARCVCDAYWVLEPVGGEEEDA